MRIAVLGHLHHPIREPFLGGLEAHTAQIVRELSARGHDVTLFAKEGSALRSRHVEVVDVLPATFSWGAGGNPREHERSVDEATARACALAAGHDVVLNNCLNPIPYAALADRPMLTILHTPADLERVVDLVGSPAWRPGPRHRWVSVSETNAVGWRELMPGVPVEVVHNGIDLSGWRFRDGRGSGAVWSARITPEKGLHVAIDAAVAAGIPLEIAGPVSDPGYFFAEIAPRLGPGVRHLGHLDHTELAALLRRAAVFLATPLWDEPFGLAPLESMACGTPVAALDRGAMRELLGRRGGVLAADADGLPGALRAAMSLDRAGVRQRAERFSLEAMVTAYERRLVSLHEGAVEPVVLRSHAAALGDPVGDTGAGV
ncbi:glycosyltransferase [Mariniluteicoccus flavus]